MKTKHKATIILFIVVAAILFAVLFPYAATSAVLNPSGEIALKQRDLIIIATILMLIIVIPVLGLAFFVCVRYRANHKGSVYKPYWDYNLWAESLWWGFPFAIVIALSIVAWHSSFALDPFKSLEAEEKPLTIQVIALQWKWLFIYPEQGIASVNILQLPEKRPIHFDITADAPMNSFWIPSLAGQIYAMPGMRSQLNIIANEPGIFRGSSANLSGDGFASMYFKTVASTQADFDKWVEEAKQSTQSLGHDSYDILAKPSRNHPEEVFVLKDADIYDQAVMKFMTPPEEKKKESP